MVAAAGGDVLPAPATCVLLGFRRRTAAGGDVLPAPVIGVCKFSWRSPQLVGAYLQLRVKLFSHVFKIKTAA